MGKHRTRKATPLRRQLFEAEKTISWLAAETGIHQSTLSRIANGMYASDTQHELIAKAFGKTKEELPL